MKNKKGFTLIELLAVIIILAVIALIATPIVLNVIESARKSANKDSAYGLLDSAKLYYMESLLDESKSLSGNLIEKINISGRKPDSGSIYINNSGEVSLAVVYDKICYIKNVNEAEIDVTKDIENCEIKDTTLPEIKTVLTSKTDSIKVNLVCTDPESGIMKYEYKINNEEWVEGSSEYIFKNLSKETEYEIKTRCTNGVNLVSEDSKRISTKTITNPSISQLSQEPSSGIYATSRVIRITYDNTDIEDPKNYYSLDLTDWVEVNDTIKDIEFTSNGYLYAKTTDGINISGTSAYSIVNIDTTKPSVDISITGIKSSSTTVNAICSDLESGISKYEYSKDNGASWITWNDNSYTFNGLTQNTTYQYKVRCINGSGLSNEILKSGTTSTIEIPRITQLNQIPNSGIYATKRVIRIEYITTEENIKNYYSLDENNWIEVNGAMKDIEFTSNGYLYAKATDGINTVATSAYSVVNIDTTVPEIRIDLSGTQDENGVYTTNVLGEIKLTNIVPSGVKYYYGTTTNPTTEASTFVHKNNGEATYYAKACSNAGICSNIISTTFKMNKITYKDSILNGTDPELKDNLVPVIIASNGTVKKADIYSEWYNYKNKTWANAILLNGEDTYSIGDIISESDIKAYYVWIPRYRYQIFYDGANATSKQLINIQFENKSVSKSTGTVKNSWLTHPAFTFGEEELNGIWVGKFELTGTTSNPTIKPNITSLRNRNVSTLFRTTQKLSTNSSMLKNSEWGAIAYLTTSIYGQGLKEVRINNSSTFTTGCAATSENGSSYSGCQKAYNTTIGYLASTTGNISGIYDMSGGSWEYVMGVMEDSLNSSVPSSGNNSQYNSGFAGKTTGTVTTVTGITFPESKYYDIYKYGTGTSDYTRYHLGDATTETKDWNSDSTRSVYHNGPWFLRGGYYSRETYAGIFEFSNFDGRDGSYFSARAVLR